MTTYLGKEKYTTCSYTLDDIAFFDNTLTITDIQLLLSNKSYSSFINICEDSLSNVVKSKIVDSLSFKFDLEREGTDLRFYYYDGTNRLLFYNTSSSFELSLKMGVQAASATVSGVAFDYIRYSNGYVVFPSIGVPYYGILGMDNIKSDVSTVITINDIDIEGDNLYRLQKEVCYYGNDYSWSTYNYQVTPVRPFIDFITMDSNTHILPATGRNTAKLTAVVLDQYSQGIINKPVSFKDDDSIGFVTRGVVYTDMFWGTGSAKTGYTSGTELRIVNINAIVTQYD
jgi:hypothetical protein